jgi:hypothetical protein
MAIKHLCDFCLEEKDGSQLWNIRVMPVNGVVYSKDACKECSDLILKALRKLEKDQCEKPSPPSS